MITTEMMTAELAQTAEQVFGADEDSMQSVEARAKELLHGRRVIVWEGDAQTFQFGYVGGAAEEILGYPASRWVTEPTFWADTVVHPADRSDAIAFCAMATGKGVDHDFQYRARAADGRIVRLHDIVKVVKGKRGLAERLRGIMIEIDDV